MRADWVLLAADAVHGLNARQDGRRLGYTWLALAKGRLRDTQGAVGAFGIIGILIWRL